MAPHQCEITCKAILQDKNFDIKMFISSGLSDFWDQILKFFQSKTEKISDPGFVTRKKILDIKLVNQALQKIVPQLQQQNIKSTSIPTISSVFKYLLSPHTANIYREQALTIFLQLLCILSDADISSHAFHESLILLVPFEVFAADEREKSAFLTTSKLYLPSPDPEVTQTDGIHQFQVVLEFILTNWTQRPQVMARILFLHVLFIIYPEYARAAGFSLTFPGFRSPPPQIEERLLEFFKSFCDFQHSTSPLIQTPNHSKFFFQILLDYSNKSEKYIVPALHCMTLLLRQTDSAIELLNHSEFAIFEITKSISQILQKSENISNLVVTSVAEGTITSLFTILFQGVNNYPSDQNETAKLEKILRDIFKSLEKQSSGEVFAYFHFLAFLISQNSVPQEIWNLLFEFIQKTGMVAAAFAAFSQYLATISFQYLLEIDHDQAIDACTHFLQTTGRPNSERTHDQTFIAKNIVLLLDRPEEFAKTKLNTEWNDLNEYKKTLQDVPLPILHYSSSIPAQITKFLEVFERYKDISIESETDRLNMQYRVVSPLITYHEVLVTFASTPKVVKYNYFQIINQSSDILFSIFLSQTDPSNRLYIFNLLASLYDNVQMRTKVTTKWYIAVLIMLLSKELKYYEIGILTAIHCVSKGLAGSSLLIPIIISRIESIIKANESEDGEKGKSPSKDAILKNITTSNDGRTPVLPESKSINSRSQTLQTRKVDRPVLPKVFDLNSKSDYSSFLASLVLFQEDLKPIDKALGDEIISYISKFDQNDFVPDYQSLLFCDTHNLKTRAENIYLAKILSSNLNVLGLSLIYDDISYQKEPSFSLIKTLFDRFIVLLKFDPLLVAPFLTSLCSSLYYSKYNDKERLNIETKPEYQDLLFNFINQVIQFTLDYLPVPSLSPKVKIRLSKSFGKENPLLENEPKLFILFQLVTTLFLHSPSLYYYKTGSQIFGDFVLKMKEIALTCFSNRIYYLYQFFIDNNQAFPFVHGPLFSTTDFPNESIYFKYNDQLRFGHASGWDPHITIDSLAGIYSWEAKPLIEELYTPTKLPPIALQSSNDTNLKDLDWETHQPDIFAAEECQILDELIDDSELDYINKSTKEDVVKSFSLNTLDESVKGSYQFSDPIFGVSSAIGSFFASTGLNKGISVYKQEKAEKSTLKPKFSQFEQKSFRQVSDVCVTYIGKQTLTEEALLNVDFSSTSKAFQGFISLLGIPLDSQNFKGYDPLNSTTNVKESNTYLYYADLTSEILYYVFPFLNISKRMKDIAHLSGIHVSFCENEYEEYDPSYLSHFHQKMNIVVYPLGSCLFRLVILTEHLDLKHLSGSFIISKRDIGKIIREVIFTASTIIDEKIESKEKSSNNEIITELEKQPVYEEFDDNTKQLFTFQ